MAQLIFPGIAGAEDPALSPGDLVIGTKVAYHDYGSLLPDSTAKKMVCFISADKSMIESARLTASGDFIRCRFVAQ